MYILLVIVALKSVSTHDIIVGSSTEGKKVFDEHFQASPAVWRQAQNVTINTTDDEVISRIVVTDLREDKDGDATIVDGGEGEKKVTIQLKSPTLLRGYDFKVEVYAAPNKVFQNGPLHPSEIKTNAGSLNTPGSRTPQSVDITTRLPETPKTQGFPTNTEVKPGNARATRDAEVKKQEEYKPKIESPSVFGFNKPTTSIKPIQGSNVPVTVSSRLFTEDSENDDETTKSLLFKDKKANDEARNVRDTNKDDATTKNTPKIGSFNSKTTTTPTTPKTLSFNKASEEARHVRDTHDDDVTTKNTPKLGNFNSATTATTTTPKTLSFNKASDEARHVRDTHDDDATTKNTPRFGSFDSQTTTTSTSPKTPSFNKASDAARHVRETRDDDVTTNNTPKFGSFDSTTSTTSKTPSFNNLNRNNPGSSHPVLLGNDKRDARATQNDEDDQNVSTTLKPTQRNPVYTPNFERNVPLVIQNTETDKKPQDSLKNLNDQKRNARDTKDEAKEINTLIADNVTNPIVTNKNAENATEERKSRSAQDGPKIPPFNVDVKKVTSTTAATFANKQDGGIAEEKSSLTPPGVLSRAQSYPVPYPYESTTKIASSTNSPSKRDAETSQAKDDKNASLILKSFGSKNSTSHDPKTPVISLQ